MSGHSKWSSIKHQKGAADQKRSAVFGKLTNAISVAARHGADPEMNFQLRIAIDQAKAANMPKDNIERAIARASGSGAAAMEEITFEAYGPGGTAFLIETATDNRNRTIGEIRAVLNRHDGKLAETGSVGYLFKKQGLIVLETEDIEATELAAIDAGASDVSADAGKIFIATEPQELEAVRRALSGGGINSNDVGFEWQPTVAVPLSDQATVEKVLKLAEALEGLDDITNVHSNFQIPNS